MTTNFEVIDADGHITEEDSQLKKYMEAKYRDRVATLTPRDSWDRSLSGKLGTRAKDAKSWLDAMDKGRCFDRGALSDQRAERRLDTRAGCGGAILPGMERFLLGRVSKSQPAS